MQLQVAIMACTVFGISPNFMDSWFCGEGVYMAFHHFTRIFCIYLLYCK